MRPNNAGQTKNWGQFISRMPPGAIAQFKWGWDGLLRFGDSYTRLLVFTKDRLQYELYIFVHASDASVGLLHGAFVLRSININI
jgi:hypothetical protein